MNNGSSGSPLVSIIVPVYNGATYLRDSLDSILVQTYPNIEILVMDDASTDATPEIIASYGNRIRCYRQPRNRGQFNNYNDGIAMARGDYIAIYHSDDIYLPTIVEREVEFLERHSEAGAVFGQDIFMDQTGREYARLKLPPEIQAGRALDYKTILNAMLTRKNQFLRCPSNMTRASVYRDVGVFQHSIYEDYADVEMWMRIARKYPIGILEDHLFYYRHHIQSAGRRYQHLRTEQELFFKIMDLYLEEGGRALATPEALAAFEALRAEDWLMIAVRRYILGQRQEACKAVSQVSARRLLGSAKIQRWRLSLLYIAMLGLVRIPTINLLADMFHRHWHPDEYRSIRDQARMALRPRH